MIDTTKNNEEQNNFVDQTQSKGNQPFLFKVKHFQHIQPASTMNL